MRRLGLVALLAPALGCLEAAPLDPDFDTPAATTVLLMEGEADGELRARVFGPDEPLSFALPDHGEVLALRYALPPERLLLPRGRLRPDPAGTRRLPRPDEVRRADLGSRPPVWSEGTFSEQLRARFRLPTLSSEGCIESGGCLETRDGEAACNPDCSPEAPTAPQEPERACYPGWTDHGDHCEPEPPPTEPCPLGQRYDLDARACQPIAPCPDSVFYEPPGPGPFVYAQAGAVDGDGTLARPFGDLQSALQNAEGATVLLAAGVYPLPGAVIRATHRRVVGVCPEATRVELASTLRLEGARFDFERLRLVGPAVEGTNTLEVDSSTLTLDAVEVLRTSGAAILSASSSVSVRRSALRPADILWPVTLQSAGGRTLVHHSSVTGAGALSLVKDNRADLEDLVLFGRNSEFAHTVDCYLCASLRLQRARVRYARANGVNAVGGGVVDVEDLGVWSAEGDGIRVAACERKFACEDETLPCPEQCAPLRPPYTQATLRGIFTQEAFNAGINLSGVRVQASDVVVKDLGGSGIAGLVAPNHQLLMDLSRAYVARARDGGLHTNGLDGEITATVRDITVVGTERIRNERRPGIDLEFTDAVLERAHVRAVHWHGVANHCGPTRMSDIIVEDAQGSGILVRPAESAFLTRAHVISALEYGLDVDSNRASLSNLATCMRRYDNGDQRLEASHVRTTSVAGGVLVSGGAFLDLSAFDVRGLDEGLRLARSGDARFQRGVVRGASRGVILPPQASVDAYLEGVRVVDSETPLSRE